MAKKAVETKDLTKLISVADPHISPDGKQAVFVKTHIDEEENTYITNLWHVDIDSGELTQWTRGKQRVSSPQWSEDGKSVAFLSDRNEKNQLYVLSAKGGEARELTEFEKGVNSFRWSPCNKKIWFDAMVKEGKTFTDKEEKEEKEEKKLPEPYVVDKMKYKMDGMGLLPKEFHRQIGLLDIESKEVEQITDGTHHHGLEAVSHDGSKLVYGVTREENLDFVFRQP